MNVQRLVCSQQRSEPVKTLVLNAGYEPMSVVSFRRAIILVLA